MDGKKKMTRTMAKATNLARIAAASFVVLLRGKRYTGSGSVDHSL
jgi:hypothetical protein